MHTNVSIDYHAARAAREKEIAMARETCICGKKLAKDYRVTVGKAGEGFTRVTLGMKCNRCGTVKAEASDHAIALANHILMTLPH